MLRGGLGGVGGRGGIGAIDSEPLDGSVDTVDLANDSVTDAKLRESAALSVMGRAAATVGNPSDIVAAANLQYFGRRANAMGFFNLNEDDLGGVIERQTLGADGTSIVFALNGDTHEIAEVLGWGEVDATGGANLTAKVNTVAIAAPDYSTEEMVGSTWLAFNSRMGLLPIGAGSFGFYALACMVRGATAQNVMLAYETWGVRNDTRAASNSRGTCSKLVVANVTTLELLTSGQKFKLGYQTIVRRRRLSA